MGSSTLCANRNWQPITICNRHDLCSLAAFRFSDLATPLFSGRETRVDKYFTDIDCASDTEFMCKGSHDPRHHAEPNPLLKSPMTGLERGVSVAAQGAPVRNTHNTPFSTDRRLFQGRPRRARRFLGFGISGSRVFHCSSVRSRVCNIPVSMP